MSQFDSLIDRVLSHEGGYVNDPRDPGGETQWGISKAAYPNVNIRALTRPQAIEIYRRDYWQPIQGDKLPKAVAFQVLDAAVNHGVGNAIRWLQRAAGVADDGVVGPRTLAAVSVVSPADLVLLFNAIRLEFYALLGTFDRFGKGWTRRVAANLRYGAADN
ncbi:hypothetical protein NG831_06580 [Xanthomonas sacchari]|uniref:glycoside hydrolase family 108 protein n=1 Tax=Xanthomonas sacchari TaxID=56458 RepID=UPI002252D37B|nr:glycosyl hydrolase 108 family protein [Xanthomonas sacchari]MCW0413473.1 hypothetical protein [Xanthomonas sacchari]UYK67826.1 hypothetical protein NG831_06580 [Xanthomonas sacchari]